jgi:ketosteroid isomerase-like protein
MRSKTKRVRKVMNPRAPFNDKDTDPSQSPDETFDAFLVRREEISGEYIQGSVASLLGISTASGPATFFPPNGERVLGAAKVNAANKTGALAFAKGSVGKFEVLQSGSSGGLGFWTGIQHADMAMKGKKARVKMQLRVTEVFRLERGAWKLVHRHADMGKPK